MATQTLKTLREEAQKALNDGIANKKQLLAAVPALVALQNAAKAAKMKLKETQEVAEALSKACSDYARNHKEHVFDDTYSVSPIGVESGDLEIDGTTYHFSYGFDGYTCSDPGLTKTQGFLKGLKSGWAKQKYELNTVAINKDKPTDEELSNYGLMRKVKQTWSLIG